MDARKVTAFFLEKTKRAFLTTAISVFVLVKMNIISLDFVTGGISIMSNF